MVASPPLKPTILCESRDVFVQLGDVQALVVHHRSVGV